MRIERARDDNFIDNSRTVLSNLLIFCNKKGRLLILMKIQYLGHSSFMLSNAKTSVVIDPFSASVGFPFPKVTADTVTISHHHDDHDSVEGVSGSPVVFDIPGEYERKGVRMYGYSTFHDEAKGSERGKNTMFKFVMDGVVILHCGDLGHELSDNDLELVKDTNVLMIPVGGVYTIDPHQAQKLSKAIGAEIVLPMHYKTDKHDPTVFADVHPLEDFMKETDVVNRRVEKVLNVTAETIPEEREVVTFI